MQRDDERLVSRRAGTRQLAFRPARVVRGPRPSAATSTVRWEGTCWHRRPEGDGSAAAYADPSCPSEAADARRTVRRFPHRPRWCGVRRAGRASGCRRGRAAAAAARAPRPVRDERPPSDPSPGAGSADRPGVDASLEEPAAPGWGWAPCIGTSPLRASCSTRCCARASRYGTSLHARAPAITGTPGRRCLPSSTMR